MLFFVLNLQSQQSELSNTIDMLRKELTMVTESSKVCI